MPAAVTPSAGPRGCPEGAGGPAVDGSPSGGLSPCHISSPCLEPGITYAVGGNVARVDLGRVDGVGKMDGSAGGKRGLVAGFSRGSRRRLLRMLNSLNRDKVDPGRVWFVTLTYPLVFPDDPREWERHLTNWAERLWRKWGRFPVFWKKEFQKRMAPHFHLLCIVPAWMAGLVGPFRDWISQSWYEVVASGDEKHLLAGTSVELVRSWRGVVSYAAKYMSKGTEVPVDQVTGELKPVGRWWGVWNKEQLDIEFRRIRLERRQAVRVLRCLRRLAGYRFKGRCHALTVFCLASTAERLAEWAAT